MFIGSSPDSIRTVTWKWTVMFFWVQFLLPNFLDAQGTGPILVRLPEEETTGLGCIPEGRNVTYQCTVNDTSSVGSTVWSGSAFQCPDNSNQINLLHNQFDEKSGVLPSCGTLRTTSLRVNEGSNYVSQLSLTATTELNGTTISCSFGNSAEEDAITLGAIPPSPGLPMVTIFSESSLNVSWSPPSGPVEGGVGGYEFSVTGEGCGCVSMNVSSDTTSVTCSGWTAAGQTCSFEVQTLSRDCRFISDPNSIIFTACDPAELGDRPSSMSSSGTAVTSNGVIEYTGVVVSSVANLTCNEGFTPGVNSSSRTCMNNGKWSGMNQTCSSPHSQQMLEIILGIVIAAIILGLIILLSLLLFLIYCVVRHKAKRSQENIETPLTETGVTGSLNDERTGGGVAVAGAIESDTLVETTLDDSAKFNETPSAETDVTKSLNVQDQGVDERTGGGGVAGATESDTLVEKTLNDSTNGNGKFGTSGLTDLSEGDNHPVGADNDDQPDGPQTSVPSSITFDLKKHRERPPHIRVLQQPVALNSKLYARGTGKETDTVLKYTPVNGEWTELPPPPVKNFTTATLRSSNTEKCQLLVVGGEYKSTGKKANTILTFNEHSEQWVQTLPAMPTALTLPAARGYQNYLIVAGGQDSTDVNILDTVDNEWITAQPLPSTDDHFYYPALGEDIMYLVGRHTQVLRAQVPTLISGAKPGVWETLSNAPYYFSTPVTIGNILLTIGGRDKSGEEWMTGNHMYNPTTNQWTKVSDFPKPIDPYGVIVNSTLFAFATYQSVSVYEYNLTVSY